MVRRVPRPAAQASHGGTSRDSRASIGKAEAPVGARREGRRLKRAGAAVEIALILIGWGLLFLLPHWISGDGLTRFDSLHELFVLGKVSSAPYSMIGPLFSAPLWLLGVVHMYPFWWCARFNLLVFALGLVVLWRLLRGRTDGPLIRRFLLILLAGSMFPRHTQDYYGEVFSAVLAGAGILAVCRGPYLWGWVGLVLAAANTPAALPALGLVVLGKALEHRRLRYVLAPVAAGALIMGEAWLRRGGPFVTGYEGNHGPTTTLPFSGRPGFSYPFVLGLASILFSFGKGLVFFAPGLFLPVKRRLTAISQDLYPAYRLWILFLAGLVLVYATWWCWWGGMFWGPRFFLFASIPASFALALWLRDPGRSLGTKALTLGVLALSVWVGVSGVAFDQARLVEIGSANNYALEFLMWYVPEFSVLVHPFVTRAALDAVHILVLAYGLVVFAWLAAPLGREMVRAAREKMLAVRAAHLRRNWRF